MIVSFVLLFGLSVSVAGQGTHSLVEAQNHPVDNQYSGSVVEEMEHELESVQSEPAPAHADPLSKPEGVAPGGEQKDLTAFFAIGFVINILLISAFIFWAKGQWRKTKQE